MAENANGSSSPENPIPPLGSEFTIARVFDAPRDVVFRAFTQAEHLKHWWGPKGFALTIHQFDLRPGGIFHYAMRSAQGFEMWGKFIYQEILSPEKLVFINCFADSEGNTIRSPFDANWPLLTFTTVTFSDYQSKTLINLQGVPYQATGAECEIFKAGHGSMQKGFGGTWDQLAEYLAKSKT